VVSTMTDSGTGGGEGKEYNVEWPPSRDCILPTGPWERPFATPSMTGTHRPGPQFVHRALGSQPPVERPGVAHTLGIQLDPADAQALAVPHVHLPVSVPTRGWVNPLAFQTTPSGGLWYGIQTCSADTIAGIIADLVPQDKEKVRQPVRYELTATNAMWSEDGTGFNGRIVKRELLVAQDEHSRYKVNHKLVPGPASEHDVLAYLTEALERHGAPLVLKHDGGKIFHSEKVEVLLDHYGVVSLTTLRYYPDYNGNRFRAGERDMIARRYNLSV
jgi:hypothetical protein